MTDSSRRPLERLRPRSRAEYRLDAEARLVLVHELRGLAGDGFRVFDPPDEWAALAGFDLALVHALPSESERAPMTAYYLWHPDPRERGYGQYSGLAVAFLVSRAVAFTPADAWRFTIDLAVPVEVRGLELRRVVEHQLHCPEDVIRDVLRGRC